MGFVLNMLIFAIIFGVILGIVSFVSDNRKKTSYTPEHESIVIKPTITKEFYVTEASYKEIAPKYIRLPYNADFHSFNDGGIGFLNFQTYSYSAKYVETNRMRKRKIEVFDDQDIKSQILTQGYTEPITYELTMPDPATERQIDYIKSLINETSCKIEIPLDKLSALDASGIIYYLTEGGHTPSKEIIQYLGKQHIKASYCYPDWLAFQNIWDNISEKDKIAFFIFCVYRDEYSAITENYDYSSHINIFKSFATQYEKNEKFVSSMNKHYHDGHDLVRFGKTVSKDNPWNGGSKQTMAYREAIDFLHKNI